MSRPVRHLLVWVLGWGLMLCGSAPVQACATCFGAPDAAMTKGLNWGIFTLLVVVMMVLAGAASFFVFLARRAASVREEVEEGDMVRQAAGKVH